MANISSTTPNIAARPSTPHDTKTIADKKVRFSPQVDTAGPPDGPAKKNKGDDINKRGPTERKLWVSPPALETAPVAAKAIIPRPQVTLSDIETIKDKLASSEAARRDATVERDKLAARVSELEKALAAKEMAPINRGPIVVSSDMVHKSTEEKSEEIAALKHENGNLIASLENATYEINANHYHIANLSAMLGDRDWSIHCLSTDLGQSEVRNQILFQHLDIMARASTAAAQAAQQHTGQLTAQLSSAGGQYIVTDRTRVPETDSSIQLSKQLDEIKNKAHKSQQDLEKSVREKTKLELDLAQRESLVSASSKENESLKGELGEKETELNTLKQSCENLIKTRDELGERLISAQKAIGKIKKSDKAALRRAEGDLSKIKSDHDAAKKKILSSERIQSQLQKSINTLNNKIKTSEQKRAAVEKKLGNVRNQLFQNQVAFERKIGDLKGQLFEKEQEVRAKEEENRNFKTTAAGIFAGDTKAAVDNFLGAFARGNPQELMAMEKSLENSYKKHPKMLEFEKKVIAAVPGAASNPFITSNPLLRDLEKYAPVSPQIEQGRTHSKMIEDSKQSSDAIAGLQAENSRGDTAKSAQHASAKPSNARIKAVFDNL